jgi:hypothetical protein
LEGMKKTTSLLGIDFTAYSAGHMN